MYDAYLASRLSPKACVLLLALISQRSTVIRLSRQELLVRSNLGKNTYDSARHELLGKGLISEGRDKDGAYIELIAPAQYAPVKVREEAPAQRTVTTTVAPQIPQVSADIEQLIVTYHDAFPQEKQRQPLTGAQARGMLDLAKGHMERAVEAINIAKRGRANVPKAYIKRVLTDWVETPKTVENPGSSEEELNSQLIELRKAQEWMSGRSKKSTGEQVFPYAH